MNIVIVTPSPKRYTTLERDLQPDVSTTFANGEEAKTTDRKPNAVFLDLDVSEPGDVNQLKNSYPHSKIIGISGTYHPAIENAAKLIGLDGYVHSDKHWVIVAIKFADAGKPCFMS